MPYFLSVDLETTGLIGGVHSPIEVAAILTDNTGSIKETFHQKIIPEGMIWSAFCLKLHEKYIANYHAWERKKKQGEICDPDEYISHRQCANYFESWLRRQHGIQMSAAGEPIKFIPVGKNYTGFDLTFIKGDKTTNLIPPTEYEDMFDHRAVDIGGLFWNGLEEYIPRLGKCKKRAKQSETVAHTALEDAQDCLDLLFYWNENNKNKW